MWLMNHVHLDENEKPLLDKRLEPLKSVELVSKQRKLIFEGIRVLKVDRLYNAQRQLFYLTGWH